MFMSSYLVTAVASSIVSSINESDCKENAFIRRCNDGNLMLIPLAGPFLTHESFPVRFMLAGPQILGALLAVAGYFYSRRPVRRSERVSFDVQPLALPTGGVLTATLTF